MPKGFLTGTKGKIKSASTLTPDQEELLTLIKEGITSGEGPLKDIFGAFDKGAFEEGVSKPALKQFQEEVLPMIQEKFIAGGQVGGSGQRRAQNKAGVDLQSRLAELMYGAQNQQKQNQLQGINSVLGTRAKENIYQPGTEGALQGLVKGVGTGFGNAVGNAIPGVAQLGAINKVTDAATNAVAG